MKKFYFLTLVAMLFCSLGINAAEELTFSNVSLAPGSKVEALTQDQQITFNTNMDAEIGYMLAQIEDETGAVVLANTTVYDPNFNATGVADDKNPKDAPQNKKDPHFTFVCPSNTKLYAGHTYSLVLTAYASKAASQGSGTPLAKGKIEYVGACAAYKVSDIKLLSISPDLDTFVITGESNASITLKFDGKVRLDKGESFVNTGFGTSNPFASFVPGDDKETVGGLDYSTTWTLTPGKSDITCGSDLLIAVSAYDMNKLHVSKGIYSTGEDETSYYTFTVMNDCGKEAFTISPNAKTEKIQSLYSFEIGSESGIAVANIAEPAVLYQVAENGDKTEVAQVKWNAELNLEDISGDEAATKLRLFLDKPVTKAGKYLLHIPRNYFNFGTGMLAKASANTDVEFTIAKDADEPAVTFTPDGEVKSLSSVQVSYPDGYLVDFMESDDYKLNEAKAFVFNESKELVTTASFSYPNDPNDFHSVVVNLEKKITTPGKYTLLIPEQTLSVQKDDTSVHAKKVRAARAEGEDGDDWEPGTGEDIEYTFNNGIVKEFTVVAGSIDNVTLKTNPVNEATVAEIQSLDIVFEGAETVACGSGMAWWKTPKNVDKSNPYYNANYTGNKVTAVCTEGLVVIDGNKATLTPSNGATNANKVVYGITKDCEIVLSVPEGFFVVNGIDYPAFNLKFTIKSTTGIDAVNADSAASAKAVYTLSGIKVNGKAPKGVIIVNGKKFVNK